MKEHGVAVMVFAPDGEVMVFPRLNNAAAWLESLDVLDGEYECAFTLDGHVVAITGVHGGPVSLHVTVERDDTALRDLLLRSQARIGLVSDLDDLVSVANELLRHEWDHRWPHRPSWLRRCLYGDHPPQV